VCMCLRVYTCGPKGFLIVCDYLRLYTHTHTHTYTHTYKNLPADKPGQCSLQISLSLLGQCSVGAQRSGAQHSRVRSPDALHLLPSGRTSYYHTHDKMPPSVLLVVVWGMSSKRSTMLKSDSSSHAFLSFHAPSRTTKVVSIFEQIRSTSR